MIFKLTSISCSINGDAYVVSICFDHHDLSLNLDQFIANETTKDVLNSLRLQFYRTSSSSLSSDDEKNSLTNHSDEVILFDRLLSVHSIRKEKTESTLMQVDLNYVDVSESLLWTVEQEHLEMDSKSAQQFVFIVTKLLSKFQHRPKNLLVFVNPQCGKDKAKSVYEEKVLPLFEEAGISVKTICTEHPNHAKNYIEKQSIDQYDGLICVGGDGMFSELCHGLLLKTAKQNALDLNDPKLHLVQPKLHIGVIPAGSTDAVVFGTTGHNDPVTSALQIILGESIAIDIPTVHNEKGFVRFMATMFAYGFFGNIIHQSDHWRLLGPLRYNIAGVLEFLRSTSYHVELTIIPPPEPFSTKILLKNLDHALIGSKDQKTKSDDDRKSLSSSTTVIKRESRYRTVNCLNMPCRCDKSRYGMSPSVHLGDGSFDVILVKQSWSGAFLRFLRRVAHDGRSIDELPNVERFRATEVLIRPILNKNESFGYWACDGELIEAKEVRIRAHHQVLKLFATGIRPEQIKKINDEDIRLIDHIFDF